MNIEDEAAKVIADLLPGPLIARMDHAGRTNISLYEWEARAVDWLREYRERGGDAPLNNWTMNYVEHGPPPWRDKAV